MFSSGILGPYVITNVIALFLVIGAILSPRLVGWLFVLIFLGAAIANTVIVIHWPESYVEGFARSALVGFYRDFIGGFFREHTQAVVLAIAFGQLCIALLLSRRDPLLKLGVIGGVLFLLGIVPLGMNAALPAPLLMVVALGVMYRRLKMDESHAEAMRAPRV